MLKQFLLCVCVLGSFADCSRAEEGDLVLPEPVKTGGMPLMEALANRASCRDFSAREVDAQTLSDLLWAAWGINRPDGRRTAPSALNKQEITLYVILKSGVYTYDAPANALRLVVSGDKRDLAGTQEFTHSAPVTLVYVADSARQASPSAEYAAAGAGFIGQNVYLFAAANGMATVFRASIDRNGIRKCFGLADSQIPLFAQSVGYEGVLLNK